MTPRRALPWSVNFLELSERGARVVRRFCRITRLDRFVYTSGQEKGDTYAADNLKHLERDVSTAPRFDGLL